MGLGSIIRLTGTAALVVTTSGAAVPSQAIATTAEAERTASAAPEMRRLRQAVTRAELIFVGEIMNVGKPPPFESTTVLMFQRVAFRIDRVLKGRAAVPDEELPVDYLIRRGASNAVSVDGLLLLPPATYRMGSKLIVMVRRYYPTRKMWLEVSPAGSMPATEENLSNIELLINAEE